MTGGRRLAVVGIVIAAGVPLAFAIARGANDGSTAATQNATDRGLMTAAAPKPKPKPVATKGISAFRYGEHFSGGSRYDRYAYLVVDRENARAAAPFPGKALVYTSGADIANFNTGVSKARATERGWVLRDSGGSIVESDDYDGFVLGDVANVDYQREWLRNVLALLRSTRVEGVFIDDVMADLRSWTRGRVYPAKYPDQASWSAAMLSFVNAVGPALKARGYYVLVNADGYVSDNPGSNDGTTTAAWWQRLAPAVSGLLTEYWVQSPLDYGKLRAVGSDWDQQWDGWEQLVSVAQRAGADFFGLTYGRPSDVRSMRFGRGSFLLDWNGKGGAFAFDTHESDDPFNTAWTVDIGSPLRSKVKLADGVWRRRYTRAIVVVNATGAPVSVLVNGAMRTIDATDAVIVPT